MSHQLTIPPEHRTTTPTATLTQLALTRPPTDGPNILLYDIETAPSLVYTWDQYKTNVIATERDWYILAFAYKWLDGRKERVVSLRQADTYDPESHDDRHTVDRLWALFDTADIVVAHNGDRFDQVKSNARFLFHGYSPPSPYGQIDTLKEAKRYFRHYANSLNELARYHRLGTKIKHTGIALWLGCMAGDPAAWRQMERYNLHDVRLLEELYFRLLPWIGSPGHVNRLNWNHFQPSGDRHRCASCGSGDVIKRGSYRTAANRFQAWQCKVCGHYSRSPFALGEKTELR